MRGLFMADNDNIESMKITIATGLYPPESGGPATYTVLLEKELPKKGYEVSVVPFSRSRHLPKVIRHFHYFFLVSKEAKSSDFIFAQDVASVGLPALMAARLTGTTFLVRVPGDYAWEQATQRYGVTDSIDEFQTKKYGIKVQLLRFIQTIVTRYSDAVVTPSDYFNKLVTNWGVPNNKVHTIYNGVDLSAKSTKIDKVDSLTIVTAGRLVPWKGFDTIISIIKDLPGWNLVILGNGPEEGNLKNLTKELNLEDRIKFTGLVSREEVLGWCEVADVFVLNTAFESFSYQIVEAMASGIPVITTNVGSIPELIENEAEGVLVSPNDKAGFIKHIQTVDTDKDIWQKRTVFAKLKVQKFSVTKTMEELDTLLKDKSV